MLADFWAVIYQKPVSDELPDGGNPLPHIATLT
jgi:hypothetical protein